MKDLLIVLGKRVHELRSARKWSQEEFAHISGLHRTYIGQIERGEKNISFGNLLKLSSVLGVSLSDLFAGIENGAPARESSAVPQPSNRRADTEEHLMFEIQKLVARLGVQRTAMDQTIGVLEELAGGSGRSTKSSGARKTRGRERGTR